MCSFMRITWGDIFSFINLVNNDRFWIKRYQYHYRTFFGSEVNIIQPFKGPIAVLRNI